MSKLGGVCGAQNRSVHAVHEDSSTEATNQIAAKVELCKTLGVVIQNKSSLRTDLLNKRRAIAPDERNHAGERALQLLKNSGLVSSTSIVAAYWPMADEFDVRPIINWLHANNITCALPCIVAKDKPLKFCGFKFDDKLITEPLFKISQPHETATTVEPDIILVPLVGFDRRGYRLGMGGGFYDRTLARFSGTTIGIGFAATEVAEIPPEPHDIRLHTILTEKELIEVAP